MCLIAFAWNAHPRWRLVLAANRDEFHARPSAPLAAWDEVPGMVAGRDLEAGGTWLGACADGRVGVVTNVRDPRLGREGRSRGLLVRDYLQSGTDCRSWGRDLQEEAADYRPFNLLCFDATQACYLGNRPRPQMREITPGVHGLSNADYDTPWPKTRALMRAVQAWTERGSDSLDPLWEALADPGTWPDETLPDTGIGIELERRLSAAFIRGHDYGTRASTLVTIDHDGGVRVIERRFGPDGAFEGETGMAPGESA
jgi:uncharacterized protein with NRDE domain